MDRAVHGFVHTNAQLAEYDFRIRRWSVFWTPYEDANITWVYATLLFMLAVI